ncbi:MAG: serine hydrolase [bacterium]|nr:serine hydrolase [bacterium]
MQKEEIIVKGIAIALVAFGFSRMFFPYMSISLATPALNTERDTPVMVNPFESLTIAAQAVFVWDVNRGAPLYTLNENAQLPLASLAKIMTALLAFEEKGGSAIVSVTKEAILKEGDHGFKVGEKWRLKDLIDATLVTSSNDGAYILASVFAADTEKTEISSEAIFVEKMNQKAKQLGLHQTFFINESGFDVNLDVSGAYGSARDVALLFEYILRNHSTLMEATSKTLLTTHSSDGAVHNLENTNKLVEVLPGTIASKTGFTDLAGGNLAIAFDAGLGHPVIIVVLGSTAEERFTDAEQLLFATLRYLQEASL